MKNAYPKEVTEYMINNNINIGGWYALGGEDGIKKQIISVELNDYWGWQIVLDDKSKFRISLPWWNVSTTAPAQKEEEDEELVVDNRKNHDAIFFKIKERYRIVCDKKSLMYSKGKGNNMRNAYYSQELDLLRSQLSQYKQN